MALLSAVFFKLFLFIWLAEKCFLGFLAFLRCKKKTCTTFMHVILSKKKKFPTWNDKEINKRSQMLSWIIKWIPRHHLPTYVILNRFYFLFWGTQKMISPHNESHCGPLKTPETFFKKISFVFCRRMRFFSCRFVHEKVSVEFQKANFSESSAGWL